MLFRRTMENFAESAKLQFASLMLAPNLIVTSISRTNYN
ncbi:protein of unknown function [Clostridium beijerinckii]|nr:protein of unknown function [Clostridium beijerinckii]